MFQSAIFGIFEHTKTGFCLFQIHEKCFIQPFVDFLQDKTHMLSKKFSITVNHLNIGYNIFFFSFQTAAFPWTETLS